MKVICISGKAEHGKTTVGDILKDYFESTNKKVLIICFGDYVKYVAKTYFGWDGKKDKAGRDLLQYVGTDLIRARRHTFWADIVCELLSVIGQDYDYVLIPDTRFPDEIDTVKKHGYDTLVLRVNRLDFKSALTEEQLAHISETALDDYDFDYIIESKSGIPHLNSQVYDFVKYLQNLPDNNAERVFFIEHIINNTLNVVEDLLLENSSLSLNNIISIRNSTYEKLKNISSEEI